MSGLKIVVWTKMYKYKSTKITFTVEPSLENLSEQET